MRLRSDFFQQACTMVTHGVHDVVRWRSVLRNSIAKIRQKPFQCLLVLLISESFDTVTEKIYGRIKNAGIDVDGDGAGNTRSLFMDIYAAMAVEHMRDFGSTREDFAAVSAKTSFHGSLNPKAQYQDVLTTEDVLATREISYPSYLRYVFPHRRRGGSGSDCLRKFCKAHEQKSSG